MTIIVIICITLKHCQWENHNERAYMAHCVCVCVYVCVCNVYVRAFVSNLIGFSFVGLSLKLSNCICLRTSATVPIHNAYAQNERAAFFEILQSYRVR